jgi:hypothetical protein
MFFSNFLMLIFILCYCFAAAYFSGPASVVSLTTIEARFLRLTSDLKLSTNQADAVSRCAQQGKNRNILMKDELFSGFITKIWMNPHQKA